MPRAHTGQAARNDLAALGDKALQAGERRGRRWRRSSPCRTCRPSCAGRTCVHQGRRRDAPAGRGVRGPAPGPGDRSGRRLGGMRVRDCSVDCVLLVSSAMIFPLRYVVPSSAPDPRGVSEHSTSQRSNGSGIQAIVMRCAMPVIAVIANILARSAKTKPRKRQSRLPRGAAAAGFLLLRPRRELHRLGSGSLCSSAIGCALRFTLVSRIALTFARRFSSSSMRTVMNLITCSETRRRRSISVDQRAGGGNVHQNVETVVELAHRVGEPAAAHLLDALHSRRHHR